MLTCFIQQLLYQKEKSSFLVWQSYTDHSSLHICPSCFLLSSCLLWQSREEFTSTLWGKSVIPPPLNTSTRCKHSHSSHSSWMCMHCVHEHSMFKGLNVNHQLPSSSGRAVREASDRKEEAHASYSRRTQDLLFREEWVSITGWPCAGCSSIFLLLLYFNSKLSVRGRVKNFVG